MQTPDTTQPSIAYVGPFSFPEGGAAARRILGNALSIRTAGYQVHIGSGQLLQTKTSAVEMYQGIPVYSLDERFAERYPTLIKHMLYFNMGRKTCDWLNALDPKPVAVILYSGYSPYFLRLLPWCERQGIPLIFDAVEWYDPSGGMPGGSLSPYRWSFEFAMRYYCVRAKHIIAISTHLQDFYRQRQCASVRIPPTLDTRSIEPNLEISSDPVVTIGYTGTPSKKDLFDNFLEAILRMDPQGRHLRLRVAGVSCDQLMAYPAIRRRRFTSVPPCIETLGKVPHNEAITLIRQADFSVLLRPQKRYAQAGFPTKVVESLAMGTPVICNITSDLGNYIHDGIEGIVCTDHQPDSLVSSFERVLKLNAKQRQSMRIAARRQAEQSFDYRNYVSPLAEFLQRIGVDSGMKPSAID